MQGRRNFAGQCKIRHWNSRCLRSNRLAYPAPKGDPDAPLKALIFDSVFDEYRGAVAYVRVMEGTVREKDRIRFFSKGQEFQVEDVGILEMQRKRVGSLSAGDVGYIIANVKDVHDTKSWRHDYTCG